jgi:hypothetical protein
VPRYVQCPIGIFERYNVLTNRQMMMNKKGENTG